MTNPTLFTPRLNAPHSRQSGSLPRHSARLFLLLALGNPLPGATSETTAAKAPAIKPYTASYSASIKGIPLNGEGTRTLSKNPDGSWTLTFSAKAAFSGMHETSQFTTRENRLETRSYQKQRTGLARRPELDASFDWQKNQVNWQQEDRQWSMNLVPDALDNLNYQLKLRMDLTSSASKELSYHIADDDKVYQRRFIVEAEEVLTTDVGKLRTVRIKIDRANSNRATWIWLAKDYDYFIVKLVQQEKSVTYTVALKHAVIDGTPIKEIPASMAAKRPLPAPRKSSTR